MYGRLIRFQDLKFINHSWSENHSKSKSTSNGTSNKSFSVEAPTVLNFLIKGSAYSAKNK
jgi:hypothetical protein